MQNLGLDPQRFLQQHLPSIENSFSQLGSQTSIDVIVANKGKEKRSEHKTEKYVVVFLAQISLLADKLF